MYVRFAGACPQVVYSNTHGKNTAGSENWKIFLLDDGATSGFLLLLLLSNVYVKIERDCCKHFYPRIYRARSTLIINVYPFVGENRIVRAAFRSL